MMNSKNLSAAQEPEDEKIEDAARHFEVSPLLVTSVLVNKGHIARASLDEYGDRVAAWQFLRERKRHHGTAARRNLPLWSVSASSPGTHQDIDQTRYLLAATDRSGRQTANLPEPSTDRSRTHSRPS